MRVFSRRCNVLPANVLQSDTAHTLVALPLYFQDRQLGFLLLAVDTRGAGFTEVLREQISSALAGAVPARRDPPRPGSRPRRPTGSKAVSWPPSATSCARL